MRIIILASIPQEIKKSIFNNRANKREVITKAMVFDAGTENGDSIFVPQSLYPMERLGRIL